MELDWNVLGLAIAAALGLVLAAVHVAVRRRQQRRDEAVDAETIEAGLHIPPSLHPVIDPDICIGSLACLKACPEGDILGIVGGAAKLIRASECIGHGRCAVECPVGAIKLVFGTAERGVDLPEVDERFESSRRGVHVVGELGGMGLIRNAVEQGTQCAGFLTEALRGGGKSNGGVDVVIVGAGPAGLATALGLRASGLSFRVLDQGVFGGTIANYPRQKVVMTEPLELPGAGRLRKRLVAKEELLAFFDKASGKSGIRVDERAKVVGVDGQDGAFVVRTERGSVATRKVVLATGRRGSPRKLGVPGEELSKVTYNLTDAEQYEGSRVLVVGGGDAAVEAACSLAEQDCEVALSYRGDELSRCRPPNRARAEELADQGHLALLLGSQVKQIDRERVAVQKGSDTLALPNEYVIACLGGELPLEFLKNVGVQVRRHHGEAAKGGGNGASRRLNLSLQKDREQSARSRRRLWLYAFAGLAIVATLWAVGHAYYPLSRSLRLRSPLHPSLKSAGPWGHGVGIGATAVMLLNFVYYLRKRWRLLNGWGTLRSWLDFHVFVGFMSPLVIAFHAAFQSNNHLATGTSAALAIVVGTGLIGRFFYGLIPGGGDKAVEMSELLGQLERLKERLQPLVAGARAPATLESLYARASRKPSQAPLLLQILAVPLERLFLRIRLLFALPHLPPDERGTFREALIKLQRLRRQVGLFKGIKRLMGIWRTLHASLAVLLVFAIAAHVAVSMYLGYGFGAH